MILRYKVNGFSKIELRHMKKSELELQEYRKELHAKDDEKRLEELLDELLKIFSSDKPEEYGIVIKDINRELRGIVERNRNQNF